MRKVYITGGSGLVGRNLIERLDEEDIEYCAPRSSEVDLLDIRSLTTSIADFAPDVVIHCAGLVGGIAANIAEPYSFCEQNTRMGINIISAARQSEVENLLNLGSSCMYPAQAENPLSESMILTGALEPTNEGYAIAKILTARLCDYASAQFGLAYKTVIPCNLFGRYDHFDAVRSHMIPSALLKTHRAKESGRATVEIWGDGQSRREFMYAGDFADFLIFSLREFDKLPASMNVGLGHDFTINEYYEAIAQVVGFEGDFVHDLSKPAGMRQKLVDVSEQQRLGWSPKHTLEEGLVLTYEYMQECI